MLSQKKPKKRNIPNFRVWSMKIQRKRKSVPRVLKMDYKDIVSNLQKMKTQLEEKDMLKFNTKKRKKGSYYEESERTISPVVEQIMEKVSGILKDMKKTNRANDIENFYFLKQNITNYDENKYDNHDYLNQNKLPKIVLQEEKLEPKDKVRVNYGYINDKLRLNLTKAYNSYLPLTHLRNLNIEKQNSREAKKKFDAFKKQIYDEIEEKTKACKNNVHQVPNVGHKRIASNSATKKNDSKAFSQTNTTWFTRPTSNKFFARGSIRSKRGKSAYLLTQSEKEEKERFEKNLQMLKETLDPLSKTLNIDKVAKYINSYDKVKYQITDLKRKEYFPELDNALEAIKKLFVENDNFKKLFTEWEELQEENDMKNKQMLEEIKSSKERLESIDN